MTDNLSQLYMPAEWQRQWAVQLTWPHEDTDWCYCLDDITQTFIELAEVITRYERLIIVTPHREKVKNLLSERLTKEAMNCGASVPRMTPGRATTVPSPSSAVTATPLLHV